MESEDQIDDVSALKIKEFLVDLYFHSLESSEEEIEINKKVLEIFKICSNENSNFEYNLEWYYLK